MIYEAYLSARENETLWLSREVHRIRVLAAASGEPRVERLIEVLASPRTIEIE